ncbi:LLM class flavin-dependent oxidoreductase [Pelagibacterium lentulum]|uniref:Luciferase-like monooxygenase n=1 Tax=Pelagibacterium lentulum TaxID=2029865 RepID=A0A916R556_9HYPH|nr:LLM class flavin-dependent oxidoreductase [Pelagibacterium lentulum]GGA36048.1 N5,N10-methylene tetrahydromethanopterin reductase [Pelagibacterium lentulum]
MTRTIPLSIQDLAPISQGFDARQALNQTTRLAQLGEALGYTRLWYAEHHGMASIASSAPDILIAHAAARTQKIRIGAGGVMLPNHVPLRVVETYRTLEGLYPDRIDLGIGRAGGSDGRTLQALRSFGGEQFPENFAEMLAFERGSFPDDHPFAKVAVVPGEIALPPIWLLGSSGASAQMAGQYGLGYAFAAHFSATPAGPAFDAYRRTFRPSDQFAAPHAILCLAIICAPTDAEAQHLAKSMELTWLRLRQNNPQKIATPQEADAYPWTEEERAFVSSQSNLWLVGSPETVRAKIEEKAHKSGADEVMISTTIHDYDKRLESYRLVAQAWGL